MPSDEHLQPLRTAFLPMKLGSVLAVCKAPSFSLGIESTGTITWLCCFQQPSFIQQFWTLVFWGREFRRGGALLWWGMVLNHAGCALVQGCLWLQESWPEKAGTCWAALQLLSSPAAQISFQWNWGSRRRQSMSPDLLPVHTQGTTSLYSLDEDCGVAVESLLGKGFFGSLQRVYLAEMPFSPTNTSWALPASCWGQGEGFGNTWPWNVGCRVCGSCPKSWLEVVGEDGNLFTAKPDWRE